MAAELGPSARVWAPGPGPYGHGTHRGGAKRDSLQGKKNPLETSESVRVVGRFGPEAAKLSYVTAFVFR